MITHSEQDTAGQTAARDVEKPPSKMRRTRWGQSSAAPTTQSDVEKATSQTAADAAARAVQIRKVDMATRAASARAALEKAKKALALQKQIQEQINTMHLNPGLLNPVARSGLMITDVVAALRALPSSRPFRFDRFGREIDAEGKIVDVKPIARSTLKVNINKERENKLKRATFLTKLDRNLTNQATNPWYDPALVSKSKIRKRGLTFVERGFYTRKERLLQTRELAQNVESKLSGAGRPEDPKAAARDPGTPDESILPQHPDISNKELLTTSERSPPRSEADETNDIQGAQGKGPHQDPLPEALGEDSKSDWTAYRQEALHLLQRRQDGILPEVEWWDQVLLKKHTEADPFENEDPDFPYVILFTALNNLVEHPVPIPAVVDVCKSVNPVLFLTAKERAKLRRRKRQEKEMDKRNKIRMGLLAPSPPRVKLANLARVLGKSAAANPSQIERTVRENVDQRQRAHEQRNKARQLDPEAKRKKTISKWTKMVSDAEVPVGGAEVCVFIIKCLTDPVHLFKVDRNAQQFHITGACIMCPHIGNMVIAEGSHKALKGYKNLLLRRIQWNVFTEDTKLPVSPTTSARRRLQTDSVNAPSIAQIATPPQDNSCTLLWEGVVETRGFKQWKVYSCRSESEIKKILSDRNADHYWEMFKKMQAAIE